MQLVRFVTALFCLFIVNTAMAKNILIIDSYHASYPWTKACRAGLESTLDSSHHFDYFEMDTKRINPTQFAKSAELAWQKIQTTNPDLIISMDDNALKFLGQRISDASIPLVFMGINQNPRLYYRDGKIPNNVAGVLEHPLIKQNMAMIANLLPMQHKRILFMMDDGTTSNSVIRHILAGKTTIMDNGITLNIYQTNNYKDWKKQVKQLKQDPYDALIIGSFANIKDKQQKVEYKTISEWTSQHSPIPIFTVWAHAVGKDNAIGGLGIDGKKHGESAAMLANAILKTGSTANIESTHYGQLIFSKSELARWNLQLPPQLSQRTRFVE